MRSRNSASPKSARVVVMSFFAEVPRARWFHFIARSKRELFTEFSGKPVSLPMRFSASFNLRGVGPSPECLPLQKQPRRR